MKIAVIPIKKKSIRCPHKNFRRLGKMRLYEWTVAAALASRKFDKVFISTDSQVVFKKYQTHPSIIAFKRSSQTSGTQSTNLDVIKELYASFASNLKRADLVLLQPTSPFRYPWQIAEFVEQLTMVEEGLCSVYQLPSKKQGVLRGFTNESDFSNLFPNGIYRLNASMYGIADLSIKKIDTLFSNSSCHYIMPEKTSIDIDEETDFAAARKLLDIDPDIQALEEVLSNELLRPI